MNTVEHLHLLISNDAVLYRSRVLPIQKNLANRMAKGEYDPAKAAILFRYLVDEAAKKYQSIVGRLSGRERNQVAEMFERSFRAEWSLGNHRESLSKVAATSLGTQETSLPTTSLDDMSISIRPRRSSLR